MPDPRSPPTQSRKIVFVVKDDYHGRGQAGDVGAHRRRPARDPRGTGTGDRVIVDGLQRARVGAKSPRTPPRPNRPVARHEPRASPSTSPSLAMVLSIVLLIVGAIATRLARSPEYPQVVPPTVVVTTQYPGPRRKPSPRPSPRRSSREINGVEDMLYMSTARRPRGTDGRSPSRSSSAPISTRPRCWSRTASPSRSRGCPRRCAASASSP